MLKKNNIDKIILIITLILLVSQNVLSIILNYDLFFKLENKIGIKKKYIELLLLICILWSSHSIYNKIQQGLSSNSTKFPVDILDKKIPSNANLVIELKIQPNSTIVYWIANDLENSGIIKSDEKGDAKLWLRETDEDKIYLRVESSPGILGHIDTLNFK